MMNGKIDRVTHALTCVSVWIGWFALSFSLLLFPGYVGIYRSGMATPLLYIVFWLPLYATGVEALSEVVWTDAAGKNNLAGYADSGPCPAGINSYFSVFRPAGTLDGKPTTVINLHSNSAGDNHLRVSTYFGGDYLSWVLTECGNWFWSQRAVAGGSHHLAVVRSGTHSISLSGDVCFAIHFSAILCEVRIRTGSLLMPMVLHSANNIASVAWVLTLS